MEPLLGLMLLALGTVAVATGMIDAVVLATTLALREAMAIMPALARLDGADDLAVCEGQLWVALQVCWSKGGADLAEGRHDRSLPSCVDALSGGEGRQHRRIVEGGNPDCRVSGLLERGLQATANSLRSYLASAIGGA